MFLAVNGLDYTELWHRARSSVAGQHARATADANSHMGRGGNEAFVRLVKTLKLTNDCAPGRACARMLHMHQELAWTAARQPAWPHRTALPRPQTSHRVPRPKVWSRKG